MVGTIEVFPMNQEFREVINGLRDSLHTYLVTNCLGEQRLAEEALFDCEQQAQYAVSGAGDDDDVAHLAMKLETDLRRDLPWILPRAKRSVFFASDGSQEVKDHSIEDFFEVLRRATQPSASKAASKPWLAPLTAALTLTQNLFSSTLKAYFD